MPRIRECHDDLFESALTERVIGAFYTVYNRLGFGHLESVYKNALAIELRQNELNVVTEMPIEVQYRGAVVGVFRADLVVESRVVLELKASKLLPPESEAQLVNCLKSTHLEIGLLFHFGPKPAFKRVVWTRHSGARSEPQDPPDPPRSAFHSPPGRNGLTSPASP